MGEQTIPGVLMLLLLLAVLAFSTALAVAIFGRRYNTQLLLVATTAACVSLAILGLLARY